ncbi:hypothetical protein BDR06DRAFT_958094 [Suillus hirtellus]|nr:hypothetical protein BDR06DRAFT_958094 [Suillus hirtellus]
MTCILILAHLQNGEGSVDGKTFRFRGVEGLASSDRVYTRSLKRRVLSSVFGGKVGCRGDRPSEPAETRSQVAGTMKERD